MSNFLDELLLPDIRDAEIRNGERRKYMERKRHAGAMRLIIAVVGRPVLRVAYTTLPCRRKWPAVTCMDNCEYEHLGPFNHCVSFSYCLHYSEGFQAWKERSVD